ncbi:MAG: hypothetical protein A2W93_15760 [Bacteroidetes bacterium GWF2_43_63]|nr:MAG: hypothetical protein A2W94_13630 [Bacteroidetes bacterium GWE2_42_42]OFY53124.1 MAG: hypothetical protein A2W93_15760 [Bacteroidetes bacterium GWF2_43_63]HBG70362.1 hypothetical protein [Bacteroidales bacterium]HCB60591.1 hypothetical protein [Bacteroidales bacterium]HCY22960.1 hypothetical protein [Bacteroidales bacterium]
MKFSIRQLVLIFCVAGIVASCAKDPSWDVDVRTPVFRTSLGVNDFIADSMLIENPDTSLTFVLDFDLFNITTDTFVNMPDSLYYSHYIMPIGVTVPPGTLVIEKTESKYYDLGGALLTDMRIKSGTLNIRAYNYVGDAAYIEYSLDNSLLNGAPVVVSGTVPSYPVTGEFLETQFDVSGMYLDLRQSYMHCNSLKSTIKIYANPLATSNVVVNFNDSIDILVEFKDIVIDYARGYFGQHVVSSTSTENFPFMEDLGIDYLDMSNIAMTLTMENYLGADATFTINELSGHGLTDIALTSDWIGEPINLTRATENPIYSGNVTPSTFSMNFNTSNVEAFFENLPEEITYSLSGTMNPLGNVSTGNDFVYYGQGLRGRIHAEIPMNIAIQGLTLSDTIDYELNKSESFITQSELFLDISNGFPLSASFKIFLADAAGNTVDSIVPDTEIPSGIVDAGGKVISPSVLKMKIILDESQTSHLYECKTAVIYAQLNTGGTAGQKVKFYPWYKFDVIVTGLFNLYLE